MQVPLAHVTPDLADARWFAADLHVPDRRFGMLRIDEAVLDRSVFLDTRIDAPIAEAIQVPVALAASVNPPGAPLAWLFHTSFCGSTLLARALHYPPFEVALKEPFVLRRLSDARHSGWALDGLLEPSVKLLARPWHPEGAVVIKPTHVALNIATSLVESAPGSKAVILTCSLEEFLISNLKKSPDSQAKIPALVERALRACGLGARLRPTALKPPDLVAAAGLQWAAQRELMLDVLEVLGPARARALDMRPLLDALAATVVQCAEWMELPAPRAQLAAHARDVGTRNAKATELAYGPMRRAWEASIVTQQHGEALTRARAWLDAEVLPAMRPQARRDPPPW